MKLYNHISTWAFAGLLAFTGCSQEESLEGSSSLQGFQISAVSYTHLTLPTTSRV